LADDGGLFIIGVQKSHKSTPIINSNIFIFIFFRLEFCSPPSQRTKKQKDILPDICYRRLKGILFFNRHTPISNNKLKILLDERKDLSSALEDATAERRLPQEFRSWLEKCHKDLDKEVGLLHYWTDYSRYHDNGDDDYNSQCA
jgi:hypothetical protein